MTVKQISVFVENKQGRLAEFTKVLRENNIDMRALSIAETPDFGILRVIVNDPFETACVLKDAGYVASITPVLAVEVADEPGSLFRILDILAENQINVEYTYAILPRNKDAAYIILRVADNDKASEILSKNGIPLLSQDKLATL